MSESFEDARVSAQAMIYDCDIPLLDRMKRAHDHEIEMANKTEYHRGYEDGQHSMDAEHRAVAMRLRQLPLDGGSHENLSQIARAVYHSDFGWTHGACMSLRDELVRLMGGVSDENVHVGGLRCDDGCVGDVSNGEDTGRTHDSPSNLDRNHMAVHEGVDTVIGDSDDTCCRAGGGACAAGDGRDSGEHAEVSYGGTGAIGVTEPVGCNDERGDDCGGGDSGESEVTDERLADDCGADTGCGDGGGDLHLAGVTDEERRRVVAELRRLDAEDGKAYLCGSDIAHAIGLDYGDTFLGRLAYLIGGYRPSMVTYDVLDNERQKAVLKLRKMPNGYPEYASAPFARWYAELCEALGVETGFGNVRDQLIHLLGGDQSSGIDVLRAMDGESDTDGTCPNDDPTSSITDELREWMSTVLTSDDYAWAIADRIDEQFDRICRQHEAVLQETIDGMVDERDHWKQVAETNTNALLGISGENVSLKADCEKMEKQRDHWRQQATDLMNHADAMEHECDNLLNLLRDARDEYKLLDQMSAETNANFRAMRDRVWSAEAERDELQAKFDKANGENKGLRLSIDEQKEAIAQRKKTIGKLARDNKKVWKTVHELQAKLDGYDSTHVELPRDASGNVFRLGCTVRMVERHPEVLLTVHSMTLRDDGEWLLYAWDYEEKYSCNLSASEFEVYDRPHDTAESIVRDLSMGAVTESEAIKRIEALNG